MRQLADALGCSPMTPYRYFHNKDEILAAVRTAAFDRFAEALEQAAAQAGGDLRAAGQAVGEAYVRFALGDPDGYRLMFDVAQPHPDRYPELVRASTRARRTMSASLERLVRAGVFHGDPELLGFAFWAGMHGLVMLHLAGKLPAERDFETIRGELMRLLVTGARAAA
jgi:AcrR family transcriptional regulator